MVLDIGLILWVLGSEPEQYTVLQWLDCLHIKKHLRKESGLYKKYLLVGLISFRNLIDGFCTTVSWRMDNSILPFLLSTISFQMPLTAPVLTQAANIKPICAFSFCRLAIFLNSFSIWWSHGTFQEKKPVNLSLKSREKLSTP